MNKSDSERVASYLDDLGYKKTDKRIEADWVILTTCGVKQGAEDRVYGLLPRIKKDNKKVKIILTGCLSERVDVIKRMKDHVAVWLPITDLPQLAEKLGETKRIQSYKDYLNIKPNYDSRISAFVPIGNGCDNFCSYCVVPYARGREVYRDAAEIVEEVKNLVDKNYKEITLIAQNVNSYKSKKDKANFATLLKMVNDISGEFWVRFATSHPKDMSDELIDVIGGCGKVCKHVHLPVQSGNDDVLKAMNRKYTVKHYKGLIDKIRKKIPGVTITTDIIVGFPGETKEQFLGTVDLFEYSSYDMAYISKYSPRPGTEAEKLSDDVPHVEKQRREDVLMKILRCTALKNSKEFLNKSVEVLIEGKNKKGEFYGKTRSGKNVKCDGKDDSVVGRVVEVMIDYVEEFGVRGVIV